MKTLAGFALVALLIAAIATPVVAADKTLDGTLACAKCSLHRADATDCQDVLLVPGPNGSETEYYVTKNKIAEESGEACTLKVPATVTGEISEKDGRMWITPSKIVKRK